LSVDKGEAVDDATTPAMASPVDATVVVVVVVES
jgi:hypothetical protein